MADFPSSSSLFASLPFSALSFAGLPNLVKVPLAVAAEIALRPGTSRQQKGLKVVKNNIHSIPHLWTVQIPCGIL